MKCPKCNGKGKVLDYVAERNCHGEWETVLREIPCDKCQRTPMTNEEWLRQASTEEKAKWLSKISKFFHECGKRDVYPKTMYEEDWECWLKEIHNG